MTVRALVVGSLTMTTAFHVLARPEPGQVIPATGLDTTPGGKGYRQAVALAHLGARVTLVGAVGDDPYGEIFLDALQRAGVEARIAQLAGAATAVAAPLITPDGAVGLVRYPGANHDLTAEGLGDLPGCEVALLQDELRPDVSAAAGRRLRERGATVVLDAGPGVTPELLALADVVVAGPEDARALLGGGVVGEAGALAAALAGDWRSAVVVGEEGAAFAGPDGADVVVPPAIATAGWSAERDRLCAGLALALGEGRGLGQAVRFACATAAHVSALHAQGGAELPTRADVDRLLTPPGG